MEIKHFLNLQIVAGFADNLMHSFFNKTKIKKALFPISLKSDRFFHVIKTMTLLGFQAFLTLKQLFC